MKCLFVICFVILLQYKCISSEKDEENKLLKTHNIEINKTGDKIFYPKEYGSYNNFKEKYLEKEYIKELLCNRLKIVKDFLEINNDKRKGMEILYFENLISRNSMALIGNSKKEELDTNILNINNNYDNTSLINHAKQIASILKGKLTVEEQGKLDEFVDLLIK